MKSSLHILLDAARLDGLIYQAKELDDRHRCLFQGDSESMLGHVAPWLFHLDRYSYFTDWIVEHGAKNSWGVIVKSSASYDELYTHFRKFLIVHKEDGKELYFRFYDPRVLINFLPSCDSKQLLDFFGPVSAYVMEDMDGKMVEFSLNRQKLIRKEHNQELELYLLSSVDEQVSEVDDTSKSAESHDKQERWDF